jgi:hypothetical protein
MTLSQIFSTPVQRALARRKAEESRRQRGKPAVGSTICCSDLRMTVQAGLSEEFWQWLVAQGWRPLAAGEDRYRLRALPSHAVAALFDAAPEERDRYLAIALRKARSDESAVSA